MRIFLFVLFFVYSDYVSGDLFTCTYRMEESKKTASKVLQILENNIKIEDSRLNALKRIATNIKSIMDPSSSETPPNPVSMYLFTKIIRDAAEDISEINQLMKNNTDNYLEALIPVFNNHLPGKSDVDGVVEGIVRLQNTYNVSASALAGGSTFGYKVPILSASDCYDIGVYMLDTTETRLAINWLDEAKRKAQLANDTSGNDSGLLEDINIVLKQAIKQYRSEIIKDKLTYGRYDKQQSDIGPSNREQESHENTLEIKQMLMNKTILYYGSGILRNLKVVQQYDSLCQKQDTRLGGYCSYSTFEDIIFYGRPIKLELVLNSPRVVIVHDLFGEKFRSKLIDLKSQLQRSAVFHIIGSTGLTKRLPSKERISSTVIFKNDEEDPDAKHLNKLLEKLTGLRMDFSKADHYQIVNYGIGGEYKPHYDWLENHTAPNFHTGTNRILTILLYLTDVEVGGSTVFPRLELSVSPSKGSALFFTNLDSDGNGDLLTLHGGCPVFFGSKWVSNKWIHARGQDVNFLKTVPSMWTTV